MRERPGNVAYAAETRDDTQLRFRDDASQAAILALALFGDATQLDKSSARNLGVDMADAELNSFNSQTAHRNFQASPCHAASSGATCE
jgi:hypothetical protein